jgi:hypothetical protein
MEGGPPSRTRLRRPRSVDGVRVDRGKLWRYCKSAFGMSKHRAKKLGVPHQIDAAYIDNLLIEQNYKCAVSGIVLEVSSDRFGGPFGPSLDRIEPALGYVPDNLRVVCQIVNVAMNSWGRDALERLVSAMSKNRIKTKKETPPLVGNLSA